MYPSDPKKVRLRVVHKYIERDMPYLHRDVLKRLEIGILDVKHFVDEPTVLPGRSALLLQRPQEEPAILLRLASSSFVRIIVGAASTTRIIVGRCHHGALHNNIQIPPRGAYQDRLHGPPVGNGGWNQVADLHDIPRLAMDQVTKGRIIRIPLKFGQTTANGGPAPIVGKTKTHVQSVIIIIIRVGGQRLGG